jgi:predicted transcriptional regulator of viral defense system
MLQHAYQPIVDEVARTGPNWTGLRLLAAAQAGHFTAAQAQGFGFSEQLLWKHAASGKFSRAQRGIYRFAEFAAPARPRSEVERADDDLVVAWLWSGGRGVISHESALLLHNLSDALPARIHLTLPPEDRSRRRVVPPLYVLHFGRVQTEDLAWMGPIPVTTPARTVRDVAEAHGDAGLVAQAIEQGVRREILHVGEVSAGLAYARSFDTPAWRVFPDAVADLGDRWVMHAFSGTCGTAPAADWPTQVREIVERHDGRVYYQGHQSRSGTVSVHVAWPVPGPSQATTDAVRRDLTKVLGWR